MGVFVGQLQERVRSRGRSCLGCEKDPLDAFLVLDLPEQLGAPGHASDATLSPKAVAFAVYGYTLSGFGGWVSEPVVLDMRLLKDRQVWVAIFPHLEKGLIGSGAGREILLSS